MLLLRACPPAAVPLSFSAAPAPSYSCPWPSSSTTYTAARRPANLAAVQFEALRSDSGPWAADQGVATTGDGDDMGDGLNEEAGPESDGKGIPGIYVPRQRYIAIPKAALLDAVLSQFPSDADAADFKRCTRCLDAILHAEHKGMLEEMRTSYTLTQRHQEEDQTDTSDVQAIFNGKASSGLSGITQEDGTLFLTRSLGLRTLLGLTPDPDSNTSSWQALKRSTGNQGFQIWIDKLRLWLKEQTYADNSLLLIESSSWEKLSSDQLPDDDVPIWIAAQRAVSRYEGILSPVGPRGRLLRRLLTWTGLIPSLPEATIKSDDETKHLEGHVRPNFLPRITLANIWEPASRESCKNNIWEIVKTSFRILFGRSTLQEPAFQELILLYTDENDQSEKKDKSEMLPLQLKIYEKIPIPDLPVVFPHKKLSFRILDTVRLDIATVIGLLAYVVNYKFESLASSPSAFLLDIVAISALLILVFRVGLGYKQTRDRYQLLVNKTLYEKTLASGFGSVYFLLDASEQQQYKEALLAYAMLLCRNKYQVSSRASIRDTCEQFMYEKFKAKIEMPIDKAMETLVRLGLVIELPTNGGSSVIGLPCSEAYDILRSRWDSLLEHRTEQGDMV
ncbi:uncharacterized protein LOC101764585 isoform X2 [Setaria italica]|uniref:uncharacterized protein LOC101764585 isoform X2 n=1 Tax=Setaria italica TaxID=4555 RepID=UPI0006470228|nr:uncharacterized protein LOC101764585 isoform X2 [Setaria italica]